MSKPLNDDLRLHAKNAVIAFGHRLIQAAHDDPTRKAAGKTVDKVLRQIDFGSDWEGPTLTLWAEGIVLDVFLSQACQRKDPSYTDRLICAANALLPIYFSKYEKSNLPQERLEDFQGGAKIRVIANLRQQFEYQKPGSFRKYIRTMINWEFLDQWDHWIRDKKKQEKLENEMKLTRERLEQEEEQKRLIMLGVVPCACPCRCDMHPNVDKAYETALVGCLDKTLHAVVEEGISSLQMRWFKARYLNQFLYDRSNLENKQIAEKDRPNANMKTAVQTVSRNVSLVRHEFCTEFVAGAVEMRFMADASIPTLVAEMNLMDAIYSRWEHCVNEVGFPPQLTRYLIHSYGKLPADHQCGPGRKPKIVALPIV